MIMYLRSSDIHKNTLWIWSKTKNLKWLIDIWLLVPEFIALSINTVQKSMEDDEYLCILCDTIRAEFPQLLYAVRSSSLYEDLELSTMAWQFHTEIAVLPLWLEHAIRIVYSHQNPLRKNQKLSLIIQRYIEADIAWVCFTRNPIGSRECILEYHTGIGEDLVSGKIIPEKFSYFFWNHTWFCGKDGDIFLSIEQHFWFPQDIEWCISGWELYFLQARPITTISADTYSEIVLLSEILPWKWTFLFEKNELTEIVSRPTPLIFSLIERIYGINGPIMQAYNRHHIFYVPESFMRIIGNELYIDRELELQTLLPAMSILSSDGHITFTGFRGSIRTLWNIPAISLISVNWKRVMWAIVWALHDDIHPQDLEIAIEKFLRDYTHIFELNILATKLLESIKKLLQGEEVDIVSLLSANPIDFYPWDMHVISPEMIMWLCGNSLDIMDVSPTLTSFMMPITHKNITTWWHALPLWKQKAYAPRIAQAITYARYREHGRILMIRNMSFIRSYIPDSMYYFATIDEILSDNTDTQTLKMRKKEYEKYSAYTFPVRLSSHIKVSLSHWSQGLSPWIASGYLISEDMITELWGPYMLYTTILSPHLAQYFDRIVGIISEKGWLLSHLAIMAREYRIPVVVIERKSIKIGDYVEINGSDGTISKNPLFTDTSDINKSQDI